MTTEFELPCAECETSLERARVTRGSEKLLVAECPNCGSRYYPESTLQRL